MISIFLSIHIKNYQELGLDHSLICNDPAIPAKHCQIQNFLPFFVNALDRLLERIHWVSYTEKFHFFQYIYETIIHTQQKNIFSFIWMPKNLWHKTQDHYIKALDRLLLQCQMEYLLMLKRQCLCENLRDQNQEYLNEQAHVLIVKKLFKAIPETSVPKKILNRADLLKLIQANLILIMSLVLERFTLLMTFLFQGITQYLSRLQFYQMNNLFQNKTFALQLKLNLQNRMQEKSNLQLSNDYRDKRIETYQQEQMAGRSFSIPNMQHRMNYVEKYINDFKKTSLRMSRTIEHRNSIASMLSKDRLVSRQNETSNHHNMSVGSQRDKEYPPLLTDIRDKDKFHINYKPLSNQNAFSRLQILDHMEEQYVSLKNNLTDKKSPPKEKQFCQVTSYIRQYQKSKGLLKPVKHQRSKSKVNISQEQINKQIKNTKIEDSGRQVYADLYLIKKARQKVFVSLSHNGKGILSQGLSKPLPKIYDDSKKEHNSDKKPQVDQQDIYQRIIKKREQKKNKMMQGRSSNWSVYYDLYALSKEQKKKLKGCEKFLQHYISR